MDKLLNKFLPQDIIALFVIVGAFILKFAGIDGTVGMVLTAVVVFYFGKKEIYDPIKAKTIPRDQKETVEQLIKRVALAEGVDPNLAIRVAKCESGLNPAAKNINSPTSVDRGLFQWNNYYHPEITDEMAFDAETSTRAFCKAVKEGNINWWNASRKCWDI